ncbi:PTS sugar transporter subunit IIA [Gephyromycinifex aptenodytis]|uniref:PTS sugar transporter subunit IIA n=1 Tax=Gephyromycinifex aptenodytis TaxID=2716227 RepID=UPI001445892A|nr:PTS glucose transporter subunit IIA [Gephyromycinifex aptenodytis]
MIEVVAPCAGQVGKLADVADPVFAAEMVGSGISIDPPREPITAVAPVAGTVVKAHPHAMAIQAADGSGVLVHLGLDTVQLHGEGFEVLIQEKAQVRSGEPLVRWNPAEVEAGGRDPMVLLCVLDTAPGAVHCERIGEQVSSGEAVFTWGD